MNQSPINAGSNVYLGKSIRYFDAGILLINSKNQQWYQTVFGQSFIRLSSVSEWLSRSIINNRLSLILIECFAVVFEMPGSF